jgi:predicted amidohydrolase YtcJ
MDAACVPEDVLIYEEATRGALTLPRMALACRVDPGSWRDRISKWLDALRDVSERRRVVPTGLDPTQLVAKFFVDGVIESGTAMLLEPYCTHLHAAPQGIWEEPELCEAAAFAHSLGFQLHFHAIGDGAVRLALNVIASVARASEYPVRRPVIAHAQLVSATDLPRLKGVIACVQPLWAQMDSVMTNLTLPRLGGGRGESQYALRSIGEAGATLSFGSDWPVTSADPLAGLEVAMLRRNDLGEPENGWVPGERLMVEDAFAAYTTGVAFQASEDNERGSLEVGQIADLTILRGSPDAMSRGAWRELAVVRTVVDGAWAW